MKVFITIKVGYTAGIYGNTGEQFTTIFIDGEKLGSVTYDGQYGVEHRVAEVLKEKGYERQYVPSLYGQLKTKEVRYKWILGEKEAVDYVRENA